MIHIADKTYELVLEHKDGWNFESFRDRYSEVLERYDYIVGDWGYNQLRLKGFFKEGSGKATKDTSSAAIQDYLQEYCNFGCAYFVIEKVNNKPQSLLKNGPADPKREGKAQKEEARQTL